MNYEEHIDTRTKGRYDATPLFQNHEAFAAALAQLAKDSPEADTVVGLDALGFILGSALAVTLGKGFVPVRKKGKLPTADKIAVAFTDYSREKKGFEMNRAAIRKGERVLLVDEWIETGSQMEAAASLVEKLGGIVAGIVALHADAAGKERLKMYPVATLF